MKTFQGRSYNSSYLYPYKNYPDNKIQIIHTAGNQLYEIKFYRPSSLINILNSLLCTLWKKTGTKDHPFTLMKEKCIDRKKVCKLYFDVSTLMFSD